MELSDVIIVLALVSSVTCTPYGYGVKSGAVAKAEANAASGAFGGALPAIPLSIPSGGGFSGSFSKSSSSSFASSSSSSSSSSFSFGGTAANGVAGNSIPSSLHGSPSAHNGFGASGSIAQAAAGASATTGSAALSYNVDGSPCVDNKCNTAGNTNSKCISNECGSSDHQHNRYDKDSKDNKNCLSGQCQPSSGIPNNYGADLQTANSPSIQTQTDSNDFEVNIGGKSKSTNLSHGPTSGFDASGSQNQCSYGKCGANNNAASHITASSTHPNEQPATKKCDSPDSGCDNFIPSAPSGSAASTNLQQPATHLTTPYIEPACATHNCNPSPTNPNLNNGKPSSYNVPILGENLGEASPNYNSNTHPTGPLYNLPSDAPTNSVITPKIPSYSDGIYSSPLPTRPAGSPNCNGPDCDSLNNPTYQSPSSPSCNTPNCRVRPISSGSSSQAGFVKPGIVSSPTQTASFGVSGTENNSGHNAYSGHTNVFLKPNPITNPTTNGGSLGVVAHPGSLETPKTNVLSPTQNNQGYTGGFGAPIGSIGAGQKPNSEFGTSGTFAHGLKPGSNVLPSSQSIPSYTGGFGGSAGSFDTHTGTYYQSKPNKENPSSAPNTVPNNTGISTGPGDVSFGLTKPDSSLHHGQSTPSYTAGFGKPTGSVDVHSEVGSHDKPHVVGGAPLTGLHGSFGIKPESGVVSSNQKNPTYTGGFGGSPGTFETGSKIGTHVKTKPTYDKIPPGPNTAQSSGDHTSSGATENTGSGLLNSHDIPKPSESLIPPNTGRPINNGYFAGASNTLQPGVNKPLDEKTKLPPYLGGFGGPSGVLKPNEYSVSTNIPTSPLDHSSCASGNCGSTVVGNSPSGKQHISSSGESSGASAAANTKAVAYSGSFGGPPGLLKPFDDGKHSKNGYDKHTGKIITGEHDKSASGINTEYGHTPVVKDNGPSGVNKAPSDSVNAAHAGANANAAAFASSNAFSAYQGLSSSGCNSGCNSNYSGNDGNYASSLSPSKTGALEGNGSLVGNIASANSVAGANAGSFGVGRSFASSSASAHASAGAAVKGGYGRR